jgi:GntR family transcriptional regulator / MocR family aminotransferase
MQLAIPLSKDGEPLFRQVYRGVRQAILSGTLDANDRLPSTRDLAEQLGISRTVILLAYDQLLAEGFVSGRGGSGTYVAEGLGRSAGRGKSRGATLRVSRFGVAAAEAVSSVDSPRRPTKKFRYDFVYGRSDLETFPFEMWRRLLMRQARRASVRQFDYGSAPGSLDLREAICVHLRRSRAVVCDPEDVIIVNGSQQALWCACWWNEATALRLKIRTITARERLFALRGRGCSRCLSIAMGWIQRSCRSARAWPS